MGEYSLCCVICAQSVREFTKQEYEHNLPDYDVNIHCDQLIQQPLRSSYLFDAILSEQIEIYRVCLSNGVRVNKQLSNQKLCELFMKSICD